MIPTKKLHNLFFKGFIASFLTAMFTGLGVYFTLHIMGSLPISRNMLVFLTVLLYSLAFTIAKVGMHLKIDISPLLGHGNEACAQDKLPAPQRRRPHILKVFAIIWYITGLFSVLWMTPAFMIFWFSLIYINRVIMLFSFLFGMAAAILYYFRNDNIVRLRDRFIFFTGGCTGSIIALFVSFYFMGDKISVTW